MALCKKCGGVMLTERPGNHQCRERCGFCKVGGIYHYGSGSHGPCPYCNGTGYASTDEAEHA